MANKDESPEASDRPSASLLVAISRTVGIAARTVSNGLQELTSVAQPRRTSAKSRKKNHLNITLLLQRLGQIVSEHKDGSYQALEGDEEFWKLIMELQSARRAQSIEKTIKESAKTASARPRNVRGRRIKRSSPRSDISEAELVVEKAESSQKRDLEAEALGVMARESAEAADERAEPPQADSEAANERAEPSEEASAEAADERAEPSEEAAAEDSDESSEDSEETAEAKS